jgi:hypothetical protein
LLQSRRVSRNRASAGITNRLQTYAFGLGGGTDAFDSRENDVVQRNGADIQSQLSGNDSGNIQQVLDQLSL